MDNPQPQVQDQVQEKSKRDKKMVVLLAVMVVVIMGLVGVVLYLVQQNNQLRKQLAVSPTPRPEDDQPLAETPDPTADWNLFSNSDLSFKYPREWTREDNQITSLNPSVSIYIGSKDSPLMNECMRREDTTNINGVVVRKYSRVTIGEMCATDDSSPREIWIIPDETAYAPGFSYSYSANEAQLAESVFRLILSTFEFVEKKETSDIFTRQIMMARDTEREAHLHAITSAVYQYAAEHDGNLPSYYGVGFPTTETCMGSGLGCFNLGGAGAPDTIVPTYIAEVPMDPLNGTDEKTGYTIYLTETGRVHATAKGELKEISITR